MQRRTALAAAGLLAIGLFLSLPAPAMGQGPDATPHQLAACRSEADRRLAAYSYEQVQVESISRDQNVAEVRWRAGNERGRCTVATNGRVLAFTRDTGSEDVGNAGTTTRLTCESRGNARKDCPIPAGARTRLLRQLSDSPCRPNDTYGQGPGYLWVSGGCRAEFEVVMPGSGGSPGGTTRITCESLVSGRKECAIPAGSEVRLVSEVGIFHCRPNDTYGIKPGYVWVERGCRGVFEVTRRGASGGNGVTTTRIVCQSQGTQRQQCAIAGVTSVRLIKQYSVNPCRLNETFGIGSGHIWVTNGCRGEFEVTMAGAGGPQVVPVPLPPNGTGLPDRVTCESNGGQRAECRVRSTAQVQLVRQLSKAECVRNSTWGTGNGVIWVDKGCRGEFEVR